MNKRILKAEERLAKAQENLDKVIEEVQLKCNHPEEFVHEANYKGATNFSNAYPPYRVCVKCGLAEEGWGTGYKNLSKTETNISRDVGQKYWRKMIRGHEGKNNWAAKVEAFKNLNAQKVKKEDQSIMVEGVNIENSEQEDVRTGFNTHGLEI